MARDPLAELEAWVAAHKANHCMIDIDDGYGATCWRVKLMQRGKEFAEAHETNFWSPKHPELIVVEDGDGDADFEWPGLGPTILAALDEARRLEVRSA